MGLSFNEEQIKVLRKGGILSYIDDKEYNTTADKIEINEHITLKVSVKSLEEIDRYKLIKRHAPSSGYSLRDFSLKACSFTAPIYMHQVTLLETVDTSPKMTTYMPLEEIEDAEKRVEPRKRGRRKKRE